MRILILVLLIFSQNQIGLSQIVFKNIESEATRNAFTQFKDFLIKHPTDTFNSDFKMNDSKGWVFYDSIIDRFFNRGKMISEFSNNKSGYDFSSLMSIQYQILRSIDKIIDFIPNDSIFVMNLSEYYKLKSLESNIDLAQIKNKFLAGFLINNEIYPILEIEFDVKNNSFIMMMPMIYFDEKEGKVVRNFLEKYGSVTY